MFKIQITTHQCAVLYHMVPNNLIFNANVLNSPLNPHMLFHSCLNTTILYVTHSLSHTGTQSRTRLHQHSSGRCPVQPSQARAALCYHPTALVPRQPNQLLVKQQKQYGGVWLA